MKQKLKWFSGIVLAALVSGCGFHLRGEAGVPESLDPLLIKTENAPQAAAAVREAMQDQKITLAKNLKSAKAVLVLRNEKSMRRAFTVATIPVLQQEIEIGYRVEMEIQRPDGSIFMEKRRIALMRTYLHDASVVLAQGAEEAVIKQEMQREAVAQILRGIQAAGAQ
jgi:LPS-assembly lipoprotein